jgi:hypothetical protein
MKPMAIAMLKPSWSEKNSHAIVYNTYCYMYGLARLVEALRYKPEGRRFNILWDHWNFSLT